jgi:hypothetical protein
VSLGDSRVGIFGGVGRTDVEIFDPNTEQFVTSRATRDLADFAGAPLPDGRVLLFDGEHDCVFDHLFEQYLEVQRPYAGGSVRLAVLVPLADGKVFLCGGWNASFEPQGQCGLFDPRALQFQGVGDLAVPRALHSAVLIDDHQVLIAGGSGYGDNPSEWVALDSLELYDTNTGRSARIRTNLEQARLSHCSVRLPDGRILILGGTYSEREDWLRSTEIFDPKTSMLSEGPTLGLGRSGAQTAVLPSGRVAVFGGNYDARAIEIYDPATGLFELADSLMLDARWTDFTATSLSSGAVLLVGGRVNSGTEVVSKAEIFEEVATETPSAPPMTLDSIRQLLMDSDPEVVAQTADWLVELGPQVKPILQMLTEDESAELRRLASDVLRSIDGRDYPTLWCVEIWDAAARLDAVWLADFACPDHYSEADPPAHVTSIVQATEGADFTHLVVRFPIHASHQDRARLFNLVGWTWIPAVVLGSSLDADDLTRVAVSGVR